LVGKLGATALGRELGLPRVHSLVDLRAALPLRDADRHLVEIEARLGFGVVEPGDDAAAVLVGAEDERAQIVETWRAALGRVPRRIALLRGASDDALVDRILLDDLLALTGPDSEVLRLRDAAPRERTLELLREFEPDALVVPSLVTCVWLEEEARCPIERYVDSLRALLAEHDLSVPVRSRLEPRAVGWIHRVGRLGLPPARGRPGALTLATGSAILELLPYDDTLERGRVAPADHTVWPEQAVIGDVYEIVASSPLGYLRLRTGEFVKVVGFDPPVEEFPLPRPRVVRRLPPPADVEVEGLTLPGAWLTAAVRQAFRPEDPALVAAEIAPDPDTVAFDAATSTRTVGDPFADTELGTRAGARRRGARPRGVVVRVEVQAGTDSTFGPALAARIDADLRRRSQAYAWLRQQNQLFAPRVLTAPPGTARAARDRRVAELAGRVVTPIVRVVVPE
jgi:hypothetical protein